MDSPQFTPLTLHQQLSESDMRQRAAAFLAEMRRRRSVRQFSNRPVAREIIVDCVATAATAPSGANLQPWHFVIVESPDVKRRIRSVAEREERKFYETRAPDGWLDDLTPLATGPDKPFLEDAPFLVAVFVESSRQTATGERRPNYYARLSVGIAVGMLITAVHYAGLVCLAYTPSRMGFLNEVLDQPDDRRLAMILVVGHPAEDAQVPVLERKPLDSVVSFA
ncbi:MAG: nitroreductase family protein [Planctomycetes bacterium]|nr:nitroreductase family protein [Planctomycetota bacterium]MBL7043619.1 nitroreductase family protein [Pirellulaceae bacterium]